MDEILAKAGSQAVTFAIKSGISIASTYALRTITNFVIQIPKNDARRIEKLRAKLENRIEIVSSAIDLIKLVAARGNTKLESTLKLTRDLKSELDSFDERIKELTEKVEKSKSAKSQKEAIDSVEKYINDLLQWIEEVTPFINLSLTTSGANLKSSLPQQVSPGLLLQAANYINQNNVKSFGQIGPDFQITLYSVFYHLDKESNKSNVRVDWKEDMKKALVKVMRVKSSSKAYDYELKIEQSFDDGRYHDKNDEEDKPQALTLNLDQIVKLFFSVSGNLLKLPEQDSPVLVLKVDRNIVGKHSNTSTEDLFWLALGHYEEPEDEQEQEEESDEESDEESEDESEGASEEYDGEEEETEEGGEVGEGREGEGGEEGRTKKKTSPISSSIALLEYIIRLASLQASDEQSILEVSDERLSVYLNDENPNSIREKKANIEQVTKDLGKVSLE